MARKLRSADKHYALYVRSATIQTGGNSVAEQIAILSRFCADNGWKFQSVYSDEGVSGNYLDRPAMQLLIRDVEKGSVNAVVVTDAARLSRSIVDLSYIYDFFAARDVNVISIKEGSAEVNHGEGLKFTSRSTG